MCLYLQYSAPPRAHYDHRPGLWVGLKKWPSPAIGAKTLFLNPGRLEDSAEAGTPLSLCSPQTTGIAGGEWCAYGLGKVAPELPLDQRIDDGGSLVFDTAPLKKPLALMGASRVNLTLAADRPQAFVVARISDVAPDGSATRVSYGVLNLTHRDSHAAPHPLEPGRRYQVSLALTEAAHEFAPGHRLRISLSSCYWPMIWPSPEAATLTVWAGESSVVLSILKSVGDTRTPSFAPVRKATPLACTILEEGAEQRRTIYDPETDKTTMRHARNDGSVRIDEIGTVVSYGKVKEFTIAGNDPLSAEAMVAVSVGYRREDWDARLETRIHMSADRTHFILHSDVDAFSGGERFFSRSFDHRIPRDQI